MPQFSYRARNAKGELVEGVLECADRTVAIHQIEQQRCIPIRIDVVGARPEAVDKKRAAAAPVAAVPLVRHHHRYTEADRQYLHANGGVLSDQEIADHLGASVGGVTRQATQLGLRHVRAQPFPGGAAVRSLPSRHDGVIRGTIDTFAIRSRGNQSPGGPP